MNEYICKEVLLERISLLKEADLYTVGRVVAAILTQPTVSEADIKKSILQEVWNKALGYECFGLEELDEVMEQIKEQGNE